MAQENSFAQSHHSCIAIFTVCKSQHCPFNAFKEDGTPKLFIGELIRNISAALSSLINLSERAVASRAADSFHLAMHRNR